jgi:hypothetical protein
MSIIGMPSLAMLLVLANFAVCLSVDRPKHTSDRQRPATTAPTLGGAHDVNVHRMRGGPVLTATIPPPTD